MLNISNPLDPTIIGSTVVTQDTVPNAGEMRQASSKPFTSATAGSPSATRGRRLAGATGGQRQRSQQPGDEHCRGVRGHQRHGRLRRSPPGNKRSGLEIYQISALTTQSVTAEVTVPTTGVAAVVPNSFSVQPNQIIAGSGMETL